MASTGDKLEKWIIRGAWLLVILVVLVIGFLIYKNIQYNKIKDQYKQNTTFMLSSIEYWKTNSGKYVATTHQQTYTAKQLKKATNETIKAITNTNKELGIKLRKTEYLLHTSLGLRIDTVLTPYYDTINNNIVVEIDTLIIKTLKIKRIKELGTNKATYTIEYKPTLTGSINWYKEGKWKIKNIVIWRKKIYKIDLVADDGILQPTSLILIKVD